jgi:hypothetical protein
VNYDGISCPDNNEKPFFVSESTDAMADLSYLSEEPAIGSFTIEFWVKLGNHNQSNDAMMVTLSSESDQTQMYFKIGLD